MIQLHPDCLIFRTADGDLVPCSAENVTIELIGETTSKLDPEVVRQAAAAVVYYFKTELERETVSVSEFAEALGRVLQGFGYDVVTSPEPRKIRTSEGDLFPLAHASAGDFELGFFRRAREELHRQLETAPDVVMLNGLRRSVMLMLGAKRWGLRCEALSDQIVSFLRDCLSNERASNSCALVVRS